MRKLVDCIIEGQVREIGALQRWYAEGMASGTLKERISPLRSLAEKIDKQNIPQR